MDLAGYHAVAFHLPERLRQHLLADGTSIESFLLRIENGLVTQWNVADRSLDLANYLHDQGMELPTFVEVPPLIRG